MHYMILGKWHGDEVLIQSMISTQSTHETRSTEELVNHFVAQLHETQVNKGESKESLDLLESKGEGVLVIRIFESQSVISMM